MHFYTATVCRRWRASEEKFEILILQLQQRLNYYGPTYFSKNNNKPNPTGSTKHIHGNDNVVYRAKKLRK